MANDNLPIGLFDSGLGGLTVLKELVRGFPHENFVYLGDTARLPYGTKSPATITEYLKQNINYLHGLNVKAIVVACNSASSVLSVSQTSIPIYDVIRPGARAAAATTENGRIGVLATRTTVAQKAYLRALQDINPAFQVYQQACPLLVPLVEEGWDDDPITNLITYRYVNPLLEVEIDTLIMGCTHYPVLRTAFQKVVGSRVRLVDSAQAIADQLQEDFEKGLLPQADPNNKGSIKIYSTDTNETFQQVATRMMDPIAIDSLQLVDLR